MATEKLIFSLKPSLAVALVPAILLALLSATIVSIFIGSFMVIFSFGLVSIILIGLLIFVLVLSFRILNLRARKYLFYAEKAEFYEGFLNIVQRTVQYNKVTDCILTRTVWDRIFATGTLRLVTAGHTAQGGYGLYGMGGGIAIQYIKNPDAVYQKVQQLLRQK